jgi:hypothetical protein
MAQGAVIAEQTGGDFHSRWVFGQFFYAFVLKSSVGRRGFGQGLGFVFLVFAH